MRRLAWTSAARISDKYQIRLTRSIYYKFSDISLGWLLNPWIVFKLQQVRNNRNVSLKEAIVIIDFDNTPPRQLIITN